MFNWNMFTFNRKVIYAGKNGRRKKESRKEETEK